jgi:hypothetical protein
VDEIDTKSLIALGNDLDQKLKKKSKKILISQDKIVRNIGEVECLYYADAFKRLFFNIINLRFSEGPCARYNIALRQSLSRIRRGIDIHIQTGGDHFLSIIMK